MDCAGCARAVETGVANLPGVQTAQVDFVTNTLRLTGDVAFDVLQERVQALGKSLVPPDAPPAPVDITKRGGVIGFWDYLVDRDETRQALMGGGLIVLTFVLSLLGLPMPFSVILYTVGMLITLMPIARSGWNTLLINRTFNINLLMTIAAVGAIVMGEYLEGATVIFLFAIGEALEGYTSDRARDSIRSLMTLKPTQAIRLHDAHEDIVPIEALRIGDTLLIKPGENIPMDGTVLTGLSRVNQASITGESMAVEKQSGDGLFAGTINGEGTLTMTVTRLAADNTLSRIIALVEEAQSVRAPSQRLIDTFAHYYTPAVVVLAALVAIAPPLLFNAPLLETAGQHGWLYRALSLLVIACPCALVISTPVTIISAITAAARRGVLIKGGAHLEALGTIRAIAFDKTGTLTQGRPTVTDYHVLNCATDHATCDDILALAAAVERRTTHPLAQAIVRAAQDHHVQDRHAPAEAVEMLAGQGVRGTVGEKRVTLGSHSLFDKEFPHSAAFCTQVKQAEAQGYTTMLLAEGNEVRGYIGLADEVRPSSARVVSDLHALGLPTIMLTGDHAAVARTVADQVGVQDVRAGLMPQDKVHAVKQLTTQYGPIAMIGDGVNDTPALAAATLGIAMGGAGSPQALETADMALMADDLTQLPFAIRLARFARRLIRQNVILSFGLKAVFVVLALTGLTSLWVAIFADVGMALLVTLNGMRPLRFEKPSA